MRCRNVHCHMQVDAHVKKTQCPRKDNGRTCPGPLSNKQSSREMVVVEHARSLCRTSTFRNTWHLISFLFWLCFLWCISLVSVCGSTFPLFQFAVILSRISTCYGAFSCRSSENRGTRSGPMWNKHHSRTTNVELSPFMPQFAVGLFEMLALKWFAVILKQHTEDSKLLSFRKLLIAT